MLAPELAVAVPVASTAGAGALRRAGADQLSRVRQRLADRGHAGERLFDRHRSGHRHGSAAIEPRRAPQKQRRAAVAARLTTVPSMKRRYMAFSRPFPDRPIALLTHLPTEPAKAGRGQGGFTAAVASRGRHR